MTSPAHVAGRLSDMDGLTPLSRTTTTPDPQAAYRRIPAGEIPPVPSLFSNSAAVLPVRLGAPA